MVSTQGLVAALTLISVLILALNFLLAYINFKAASLGDAATREQIMRERFSNIPSEREFRPHREIKISEPRVRNYGFTEWVKSLRPRADYPGYTHFNVTIQHTNWPSFKELAASESEYTPTFNYPSESELRENEKLQQLGVAAIQTIQKPIEEGEGKFIITPIISYQIFADTADPDRIETLQESFRDIILEIERGEDIFQLVDPVKTKADLESERAD